MLLLLLHGRMLGWWTHVEQWTLRPCVGCVEGNRVRLVLELVQLWVRVAMGVMAPEVAWRRRMHGIQAMSHSRHPRMLGPIAGSGLMEKAMLLLAPL